MQDDLLKIFVGILGAVITGLFTYFGTKKIRQDEDFHRETHSLSLFRALADENPRLQLAAAAVLVERLRRLSGKRRKDEVDLSEQKSISHALISVLKSNIDEVDGGAHQISSELAKYVGEQIPRICGALPARAGAKSSPMCNFDWQDTRLVGCYWKAIDARNVDFFQANLNGCGLREARLDGAILMRANLNACVLRDANLAGANLAEANVENADFAGADLSGTDLSRAKNWQRAKSWAGAKYDSTTKFPEDLDPIALSMTDQGARRPR